MRLAAKVAKGSSTPATASTAISTPSLSTRGRAVVWAAAAVDTRVRSATGSLQQALAGQEVLRHRLGRLAADLDPAVELLQRREVQFGEYRREQFADFGMLLEHRPRTIGAG